MDLILGNEFTFKPISNLDRYGFSYILAHKVGLKKPRRPFCVWVHGWSWWDEILESEDIVGPRAIPRGTSIIVASASQKIALDRSGYNKTTIGGLPFAYIDPQNIDRNQHAMLAFIAHSAEAEKFDVIDRVYLDYLESVKNNFDSIYVSVFALDHSDNLSKEICRRGLKLLRGANPADKMSLIRTRRMLEYFKYVSTNTMGSHVAYALSVACCVSVFSPLHKYDSSALLGTVHGFDKRYAERMEYIYSEIYAKNKFPSLFNDNPLLGYSDEALGLTMIGAAYRLNVNNIIDVLGWRMPDQLNGYMNGAIRRSFRLINSLGTVSK